MLGCPNLPQSAIDDEDCDEGQAARSFSDETVGTMFAAQRGHGAYAGPIFAGMPAQRIFCNDTLPPEMCRYMESFEKKHSNHGLSAEVAGAWVGGAGGSTCTLGGRRAALPCAP